MKHYIIVGVLVILCTFLIHAGLISIGILPVQASSMPILINPAYCRFKPARRLNRSTN